MSDKPTLEVQHTHTHTHTFYFSGRIEAILFDSVLVQEGH